MNNVHIVMAWKAHGAPTDEEDAAMQYMKITWNEPPVRRDQRLLAEIGGDVQWNSLTIDAGIARLICLAAEFGEEEAARMDPIGALAVRSMCRRWYSSAALATRSLILLDEQGDAGQPIMILFGAGAALRCESHAMSILVARMPHLDADMTAARRRFLAITESLAFL